MKTSDVVELCQGQEMLNISFAALLCLRILDLASLATNKISAASFTSTSLTTGDTLAQPNHKVASKDEPRSALFHQSELSGEPSSSGMLTWGWLLFGVYVLSGLLFGGLSGSAAVRKGLAAQPNFFIGFFLNFAGYLYVVSRPSSTQQKAPAGLVKAPETSAPVPCEKCGYTNHPTAKRCAGCGSPLQPGFASDVDRLA